MTTRMIPRKWSALLLGLALCAAAGTVWSEAECPLPPPTMTVKVLNDSGNASQVAMQISAGYFDKDNGGINRILWLIADHSLIDDCSSALTWKDAHDYEPIKCYAVEYDSLGDMSGCKTGVDGTRCLIGTSESCDGSKCNGALKKGVKYGIKLRIYNDHGCFDTSPAFFKDGHSSSLRPPSKPKNFRVSNNTQAGTTLVWKEPEHADGSLDGYIYSVCNVHNCSVEPALECSDKRNISARNLTLTAAPSQNYWVWLAAYRNDTHRKELITGNYTSLCFRTPPPRLNAPTNVVVDASNPLQVSVRWDPPSDPSGTLEGYVYTICQVRDCWNKPPKTCSDRRISAFYTMVVAAHPQQYYWMWLAAYNKHENTGRKVIGRFAPVCFRTSNETDEQDDEEPYSSRRRKTHGRIVQLR